MIKITGKCNEAVCYLSDLEDSARDQIQGLCNSEAFKNSVIRVMPDCHAGAGCTIGTTMTLADRKVVPNHVGVDIGCGVGAVSLGHREIDMDELERVIVENIPSGFDLRDEPVANIDNYLKICNFTKLRFIWRLDPQTRGVIIDRAMRSIGTLGGGNHFLEVDESDEGEKLLVVHSGSRNLGLQCCKFYQHKATNSNYKKLRQDLIEMLKAAGRQKEIETELKKIQKDKDDIPVLSGRDFDDYIHDMAIIQTYAQFNRQAILEEILAGLDIPFTSVIESIHNYIDLEGEVPILRKGAVSAKKGETVLIPLNMRDGLIVAEGLGNPDWNYSAPHGAGRVMSRRQARLNLSLQDYQDSMKGIYTESVNESTIDEAPMVYKDAEGILSEVLDETVTGAVHYRPIYNYKDHK